MYKLSNTSVVKLNVIDELGKKVKLTGFHNGIQGVNTIHLNLTTLKSGIYFISLSIEGKKFTQQIIKK